MATVVQGFWFYDNGLKKNNDTVYQKKNKHRKTVPRGNCMKNLTAPLFPYTARHLREGGDLILNMNILLVYR